MTPDRWQQISSVYQATLEREATERETFLQEACAGDEELRREVMDLLAHHQEAPRFMEAPALDVAARQLAHNRDSGLVSSQLGPYEILSLLGAGGMGEVYLARDPRLERVVALKILPPEVTLDPERLQRFVREARAASALNHPNIATIHEIGEAEGIHFISMEHIEGETLQARIRQQRLELEEILDIGIQIADALDEAHCKGITHRDIKPSNLMLTPHGQVKVLDFGLAKRIHQEKAPDAESHTTPGLIMGTVDYMSPEQVLGQEVDSRTDLFSLGVVLYDMVTGRLPFSGASPTDTIGKILHLQPEAMNSFIAEVPAELERIVRKCLEKDRKLRYQHASEIETDLKHLKRDINASELTAEVSKRNRRWSLLWGTTLLLMSITATAGFWFLQSRKKTAMTPLVPVPFTTYPGLQWNPCFSPDGNQVAFTWNGMKQDNWDIYIKQVGSESLRRLTTGPDHSMYPAWSPDGQSIAFVRLDKDRWAVMLIPANGGRARQLAELPMSKVEPASRWLSWHPGGKWLAVTCDQDSADVSSEIYLLSAETGEKRRLTSPPKGAMADISPAFSPDGRSLAFARYFYGQISEIYLLPVSVDILPEGEPKQLTFLKQDTSYPTWMPDGKEIVFASGSKTYNSRLWEIPVSGSAQPRPLPFSGEAIGLEPVISSDNHRLVYTCGFMEAAIWRCQIPHGMEKPEPPKKLPATIPAIEYPQYSPNGKAIAYDATASGSTEIWICDRDGSNPLQLTRLGGTAPGPFRWSPDGQKIIFALASMGGTHLYIIPTQSGILKQLTHSKFYEGDPSFSRDGKWIYFVSDRGGNFQVWKMPAEGGDNIQVTRKGGSRPSWPRESMDGKMLFYLKAIEPDYNALWEVPTKGGEERRVFEKVLLWNFEIGEHGIYYASQPGPNGTPILFYDFANRKVKSIAKIEKGIGLSFTVAPDEREFLYTQGGETRLNLKLVENFR
jgi:eukaryotic-like serine/threonine-protein kinase